MPERRSWYRIMKERRQQARQENRLLHPKPMIAVVRERRKKKIFKKEHTLPYIVTERTGDFFENIGAYMRTMGFWTGLTANTVAQLAVTGYFGSEMESVTGFFRGLKQS